MDDQRCRAFLSVACQHGHRRLAQGGQLSTAARYAFMLSGLEQQPISDARYGERRPGHIQNPAASIEGALQRRVEPYNGSKRVTHSSLFTDHWTRNASFGKEQVSLFRVLFDPWGAAPAGKCKCWPTEPRKRLRNTGPSSRVTSPSGSVKLESDSKYKIHAMISLAGHTWPWFGARRVWE